MTLLQTQGARTHSGESQLGEAFDRLQSDRYSCRAYLDTPVERGVIEKILHTSQKTASWCNSQPWQMHIASKAATDRLRGPFYETAAKGEISSDFDFPGEYLGVYKQRRRECAMGLYSALGIDFGDRVASAKQAGENFRFFGAPHFAIVTTDKELGVYGAIDCGAFVHNFMIAALSHGVASVAQAALASQAEFFHRELAIPEDRLIVCGISFGYADDKHPANAFRTTRAPISEAVIWVDD